MRSQTEFDNLSGRELLHRDPLVERVLGIEEQGQRALTVETDLDPRNVADLDLVGDCGNWPVAASSTCRQIAVSSGRIAPDQRRGRNGLIGVSANIFAWSGKMGPCAERL